MFVASEWDKSSMFTSGGYLPSVCTAHPSCIRAAVIASKSFNGPIAVEATSNQVNQDGGYTGLTPIQFSRLVQEIADEEGVDFKNIVLGGDHLGPHPWGADGAERAMENAIQMVTAYAQAGFRKLHIDCTIPCIDDSLPLSNELIATRAAVLIEAVESLNLQNKAMYVLGSEVPTPGGSSESILGRDSKFDSVTAADDIYETVKVHESILLERGLSAVKDRILAYVVDPGVEFDNTTYKIFDPSKTAHLKEFSVKSEILFEAHSTDYQPKSSLIGLVECGFRILKVGPEFTHSYRELIYRIETFIKEKSGNDYIGDVSGALERCMISHPGEWQRFYFGNEVDQKYLRHNALTDRIRYYWAYPDVRENVQLLAVAFDKFIENPKNRKSIFSEFQVDIVDKNMNLDSFASAYVADRLKRYFEIGC